MLRLLSAVEHGIGYVVYAILFMLYVLGVTTLLVGFIAFFIKFGY